MEINRDRVEKVFSNYAQQYNMEDPKILLKYEHTFRVAALCEQIARSQSLSEEDVELAWLCGMLHDIGRFEQVKRYHTFRDKDSVSHAHFGVSLLLEKGLLKDYLPKSMLTDLSTKPLSDSVNLDDTVLNWKITIPEWLKLLTEAIYYHSDFRYPKDLTERERLFCDILRDADKIDILKVNVEVPMEDIYNTTTEKLMNSCISDAVMAIFPEGHAIPHSAKSEVLDHMIGHISLVYELVFPISRQIVLQQGYLDRMLHFQSKNPKANEQLAIIRNGIEEWELRQEQ